MDEKCVRCILPGTPQCDGYPNGAEEIILTIDDPYYTRKYILYRDVLLDVMTNPLDRFAEAFIFSELGGWQQLCRLEYKSFDEFIETVKKLVDALKRGKK